MHARTRLDSNRSACRAVEHPRWKLQPAARGIAVTATPDDIADRLLDHLANVDNTSSPRMKDVEYLALVGPVGVHSPRCSTTGARIAQWDNVRRARQLYPRRTERRKPNRSLPSLWLVACITSTNEPHDMPDRISAPHSHYSSAGPFLRSRNPLS